MIMARSWGTSGFMQFSSFHSNLILWAVYGCTLTATWNLAYGIVGSDCFQTDNGQSDCAGNRWWEQSASLPYRSRDGAVDPSYVKGHKGTEGEDWSIQKAILGRNNSCSRGIKWRASCPGWRTSEAATSISYRALFDWQFLCEHTMIGESVVCKNTQVSISSYHAPHIPFPFLAPLFSLMATVMVTWADKTEVYKENALKLLHKLIGFPLWRLDQAMCENQDAGACICTQLQFWTR